MNDEATAAAGEGLDADEEDASGDDTETTEDAASGRGKVEVIGPAGSNESESVFCPGAGVSAAAGSASLASGAGGSASFDSGTAGDGRGEDDLSRAARAGPPPESIDWMPSPSPVGMEVDVSATGAISSPAEGSR